jgi:hypothetical protein
LLALLLRSRALPLVSRAANRPSNPPRRSLSARRFLF